MLGDGRRYAESNEVARLLLILIVVVIGCGEADSSREAFAQPVDRVVSLPFTGLEAGERPKSIDGADYKGIHFFQQNHPPAGKAVCIECTYSRRFQQLDADYTMLHCPECGADV